MKNKFLIPVMAFVFVSTQAFAFEGHGFKVLSKSIETSPGASGGFITKTNSSKPKTTLVWAQSYDAQTRTNETVRLKASHSFNLINTGSTKQVYHYMFELNSDGKYTRENGVLELQPGGQILRNFDSYLNVKHDHSGSWRMNAITEVIGEFPVTYTSVGNLKVTDK